MVAAVEIRSVSKSFKIGKKAASLKEKVIHRDRGQAEEFWALKGIDLQIEQGETFGFVGHNGSGKSTLLKCIAGILQPNSGEIVTRGRMSALLELGAGFHPDLTGRENIELNGLLLGLSRSDIRNRFEEIIDFAGEQVQQAVDRQVKHYSSGMYMRLGFAVAVNVEPDLLLVDEVLAVGDEAFAQKCMATIKQFQRDGRTIVLVTHGADIVREICDRACLLDHGEQLVVDEPAVVIRQLREHLFRTGRGSVADDIAPDDGAEGSSDIAVPARPAKAIRITDVKVHHPHEHERPHLFSGESASVDVEYMAVRRIDHAIVGIGVYTGTGVRLWGANTEVLGSDLPPLMGKGTVRFDLASVPLLDGAYTLQVGITDLNGEVLDWIDGADGFEVGQLDKSVGFVQLNATVDHRPDLHAPGL